MVGDSKGNDPVWTKLSQLETTIQDLERRVGRMEAAMYGNGNSKGVLSRLAVIETKIEELKSNVKWSVILAAGTFLGIIVTIISILIRGAP